MIKRSFIVDQEKRTSNTIAGVSVVITYGIQDFVMKPVSVYSYIVYIAIAMTVGGIVYFVAELIRKQIPITKDN